MPAGGSEAIPVVRALQRRLLMLAPLRARVERGERLDAVMTSMGKALFWKDKGSLTNAYQVAGRGPGERLPSVRELMFTDVPERGRGIAGDRAQGAEPLNL